MVIVSGHSRRLPKPGASASVATKEAYVKNWEGVAGLYGEIKFMSLRNYLEADHVPPKSVYRHLPANHRLRNLSPDHMPALLVSYWTHQSLATTGRLAENDEFRRLQSREMRSGNFYLALMANTVAYVQQGLANTAIKRGLRKVVKEHVQLGTISEKQRQSIINLLK